jgi:hypothetical protein
MVREQGFDFLEERLVSGAGFLEKSLLLPRFDFQGQVIDLTDLLPALRFHHSAPLVISR